MYFAVLSDMWGRMYMSVSGCVCVCACVCVCVYGQTKTNQLQCGPLQISHVNLNTKNFQVKEQHSKITNKKINWSFESTSKSEFHIPKFSIFENGKCQSIHNITSQVHK